MTTPIRGGRSAALVLLVIAMAGAILLLLVARRFGAQFDGTIALYYAIAIGVIAFGVLGARAAPTRRVGLALIAATTAMTLLLAELVIEVVEWRQVVGIREAVARHTGQPLDRRSLPQVIADARAAGESLVPSILPSIVLAHAPSVVEPARAFSADVLPLAGIARQRTLLLCNEDGRYPVYVSDRHGFNNPDDVWAAGAPRLALVGDSFTHGYCVPPDSTLASALRRRWPGTVSLGMGGSGPLTELAILTEHAIPSGADVILWLYFENDLTDLATERDQPALRRYLDIGYTQGLRERQSTIDSVLLEWTERRYTGTAAEDPLVLRPEFRRVVRFQSLRGLVRQAVAPSARDVREQVPLFAEVLAAAATRARAADATLVFVFLPEWPRVYRPERLRFDNAYAEVLSSAARAGLPVIDLTPVFLGYRDRDALYAKGPIASAHLSATGYALVATTVTAALDSIGIATTLDRPRTP